MKNIISYIFAGMVGGLITLCGNMYFINTNLLTKTPKTEESLAQTVKNINVGPSANAVPFDFTEAAQLGMPAVVHIKSTTNPTKSQQQATDPFQFFFGDGFEDFFGGGSPFGGGMGPRQGSGSGVIYSSDGSAILGLRKNCYKY